MRRTLALLALASLLGCRSVFAPQALPVSSAASLHQSEPVDSTLAPVLRDITAYIRGDATIIEAQFAERDQEGEHQGTTAFSTRWSLYGHVRPMLPTAVLFGPYLAPDWRPDYDPSGYWPPIEPMYTGFSQFPTGTVEYYRDAHRIRLTARPSFVGELYLVQTSSVGYTLYPPVMVREAGPVAGRMAP